MTAPMMRARLNGGPCQVSGHGSRCERVEDRQPVERAREKACGRWLPDTYVPEAVTP